MCSSFRNKLVKPERDRLSHIGISPSNVCLHTGKKNDFLRVDTLAQLQYNQTGEDLM